MTRRVVTGDPAMLRSMRVFGRVLQVVIGAGLVVVAVIAVRTPDGGSVTGLALLVFAFVLCVVNNHRSGFGLTWSNHEARSDVTRR